MTKTPKVYLETTVFNYFFDRDRDGHLDTLELFDAIKRGEFDAYTSEFTETELNSAPEPKRGEMFKLIKKYKITVYKTNNKIDLLADVYLAEGMIPRSHPTDAAHIALASSKRLDYILSFNFKHINKPHVKTMSGIINSRFGLPGIKITTPNELINEKTTSFRH